jgi:glycogen(starch) synthase
MKIWLLTSETGNIRGGGIGRYIEHTARVLARSGHEVTVLCGAEAAAVKRPEERLTVRLFRERWRTSAKREAKQFRSQHPAFPYNTVHYWMAYAWQMAREVEALVAEEGPPDCIEAQEYNAIATYVMEDRLQRSGYLAETTILLTLHSPDFLLQSVNGQDSYAFPAYWRGWMERQAIIRADALLCPSTWMAARVREEMGVQLPIEIIPCPMDPDYSPEMHPLPRGAQRTRELLYVGRLEPRKGVLRFLQTCDQMWRKGRPFVVTLVGADQTLAGSEETVWQHLRRVYPEHVRSRRLRWHGACAHEDLAAIRSRADAQIVPSLWENFPYSAMEALQSACPLIASDAGGQAEMVEDGRSGWLFSWEEPDSLERSMEAWLAATPAELDCIAEGGRKRIQELCDPWKIARRRVDHLQRLRALRLQPEYRFYEPAGTPQARVFLSEAAEVDAVTVVIPHRNAGRWLEGAVLSALASQGEDVRVIIVDDGSDDPASVAVLGSLEQSMAPRVRVIRMARAGLAAARNRGVEAADTAIVALLDSDDRLEPGFIERAVSVLRRHPNVALVYSWVQYTGDSTGVFPAWDLSLPYLLAHNQLIPICAIRRQAYLACGGMDETMCEGLEDWEMWIRFYAAGGRGVSLAHGLARYTVRSDSMYQQINDNQWLRIAEGIRARHAPLVERFGPELILLMESNGSPRRWHHPAVWTPWHLPKAPQRAMPKRMGRLMARIGQWLTSLLPWPRKKECQ